MRIEIAQVLGQIISFLIMFWVMKRYAWKPFLSVLEERRTLIKTNFDTIEAKTKEIDKLAQEYQGKLKEIDTYARGKTREAVEAGERRASQIQNDALTEAKTMIAKAQEEMKKEIGRAKEQLSSEIVKLTVAATEKLLQTKIDGQKQNALVKDMIDTMEQKKMEPK